MNHGMTDARQKEMQELAKNMEALLVKHTGEAINFSLIFTDAASDTQLRVMSNCGGQKTLALISMMVTGLLDESSTNPSEPEVTH